VELVARARLVVAGDVDHDVDVAVAVVDRDLAEGAEFDGDGVRDRVAGRPVQRGGVGSRLAGRPHGQVARSGGVRRGDVEDDGIGIGGYAGEATDGDVA
jgi:hypothetical protein